MPKIGIVTSVNETDYALKKSYIKAIEDNGGVPFLLPYGNIKSTKKYVDILDGLLLCGGGDVDPFFYGEEPHEETANIYKERDIFEVGIIREALEQGVPMLGICRGSQILNIVLGGKMHQHIENHSKANERMGLSHKVEFEKGSLFEQIYRRDSIGVNTVHHQSISIPGENVRLCAYAEDGTVEGFTVDAETFIVGVQWHPEDLFETYPEHNNLFQYFVQEAKKHLLRL